MQIMTLVINHREFSKKLTQKTQDSLSFSNVQSTLTIKIDSKVEGKKN